MFSMSSTALHNDLGQRAQAGYISRSGSGRLATGTPWICRNRPPEGCRRGPLGMPNAAGGSVCSGVRRTVAGAGCGKVTNRTYGSFRSVRHLQLIPCSAGTGPRPRRNLPKGSEPSFDWCRCRVAETKKREFRRQAPGRRGLIARADEWLLGGIRLRLVCERVQ